MTEDVNGSQLQILFGIDHTITPYHSTDSVALKSLTISWNLKRGYKTKVRKKKEG